MSGATPEAMYTGTVLPVIFNPGKGFHRSVPSGFLPADRLRDVPAAICFCASQMIRPHRPDTVFFRIEVRSFRQYNCTLESAAFCMAGRIMQAWSHTALPLYPAGTRNALTFRCVIGKFLCRCPVLLSQQQHQLCCRHVHLRAVCGIPAQFSLRVMTVAIADLDRKLSIGFVLSALP